MSSMALSPVATPLVSRRVRAYFAPVNRVTHIPTIFDPASGIDWNCDAPVAPWIDLGYIEGFVRSAESKIVEVFSGMPAVVRSQAKQSLDATVSFNFMTWSKVSMALSSGSDHMNVLAAGVITMPAGSGGKALPGIPLTSESNASVLYPSPLQADEVQAGSIIVVDQDYVGQIGYMGSPYSGAYVSNPSAIGNDPDYIRRVSFNVARVTSIGSDGGLYLSLPLPGGAPSEGMKMQKVVSFVDREGGSFFQEWSALFVCEGVQGDRLFLHYPRLQSCESAAEVSQTLFGSLAMILPTAKFRALPVIDGNDGQQSLCYRTYYPTTSSFV